MATDRAHVHQRLAELNTATGAVEPSMTYWKALQKASKSAQRLAAVSAADSHQGERQK